MEPNLEIEQQASLPPTPPQPMTSPTPVVIPQPKPSKLPTTLLVLVSLLSLVGLIYFYLQTQSLKQQLQIATQKVVQAIPNNSPSNEQDNLTKDIDESGPQLLTYYDDICNANITFPQLTEINNERFFWRVDASRTRTFVMDGRSELQKEPDQSVVVFTKPMGSKLPYYSSSIEIICGQNFENLSLDQYLQQTSTSQGWEGEIKYTIGSRRKFGSATLTELKPSEGKAIYRGIYKNNLILISNSNPGGDLQPVADQILNSITFK